MFPLPYPQGYGGSPAGLVRGGTCFRGVDWVRLG